MLNENGHEILDDTPVAIPLRFSRPPSKLEDLRAMLKIVSREAENAGQETFEESDDFDIGDDYDPRSPWELSVDQELQTVSPMATGEASHPVPGPSNGNAGPVPVPPQQEPPPVLS